MVEKTPYFGVRFFVLKGARDAHSHSKEDGPLNVFRCGTGTAICQDGLHTQPVDSRDFHYPQGSTIANSPTVHVTWAHFVPRVITYHLNIHCRPPNARCLRLPFPTSTNFGYFYSLCNHWDCPANSNRSCDFMGPFCMYILLSASFSVIIGGISTYLCLRRHSPGAG